MATLARSLHHGAERLRAHHPERVALAGLAAGTAVYLTLHQDILTGLNLLVGP